MTDRSDRHSRRRRHRQLERRARRFQKQAEEFQKSFGVDLSKGFEMHRRRDDSLPSVRDDVDDWSWDEDEDGEWAKDDAIVDDETLSPRDRAYKQARAAANRRIGFLTHLVAFATVIPFLLVVAGLRPAFIVAMSWGIGLAIHYFAAIVAPGLRLKWIEREVDQQVGMNVSRERAAMEGEQSKRIEELSASIAHEIRNPITAAKSLVQQMGEDPAANENVEYANVALEELERVERSISHLLRFARDEDIQLRDVQMADVVTSALETFRDRLQALGVTIQQDVQAAGVMQGDPEKLRRVIINLVGNSLEAFGEAGTEDPVIHVQAGENLAGTEVWVRLRDNGPGMEPERLTKIFSPFYTSKQSGTGLGLAITKKMVDAHGGSIEAHSDPGQGTEFVLTFPKERDDAEALS